MWKRRGCEALDDVSAVHLDDARAHLDDVGHLVGEDVEEWHVVGDAGAVVARGEHGQSVDERYDDGLDVDARVELGTGAQQRGQRGQVELVREHLTPNTRRSDTQVCVCRSVR